MAYTPSPFWRNVGFRIVTYSPPLPPSITWSLTSKSSRLSQFQSPNSPPPRKLLQLKRLGGDRSSPQGASEGCGFLRRPSCCVGPTWIRPMAGSWCLHPRQPARGSPIASFPCFRRSVHTWKRRGTARYHGRNTCSWSNIAAMPKAERLDELQPANHVWEDHPAGWIDPVGPVAAQPAGQLWIRSCSSLSSCGCN